MALYLGNDKVKINLDGVKYCFNLISTKPLTEDTENGKVLTFPRYQALYPGGVSESPTFDTSGDRPDLPPEGYPMYDRLK